MQFGTREFVLATGIALCFMAAPASAQLPPPTPPPPATLWSFLGVPQGYRYFRDNAFNRNGNRPNLERQPPLKAIADPKNLKSEDPAIKKAAEVKQAEDLKKQKIKAIRYLASIGCGCYNRDGSITDALLKSMDDCTEEVRLATVQAISVAAMGERCANCKQVSCCSEELSNKLYEIAYERDDTGCYLEPSERVRLAAAEALRVCCPGGGDDIIFDTAPPILPPSGVEQPSVLPESGGERPSIPALPNDIGPIPAVPLQNPRPAPILPPGALPTDPPLPPAPAPAPAAEVNPGPRSSRRTAMQSLPANEASASKMTLPESPRPTPLGSLPETPHWMANSSKLSVPFVSPSRGPANLAASNLATDNANSVVAASSVAVPTEPEQQVFVKVNHASLTRLPPVEGAIAEVAAMSEIPAPPLPSVGTPATPVSTRRPTAKPIAQPPAKSTEAPKGNRGVKERKLPGQEFGVGTVTSVRFKEGLAILEFAEGGSVPPGSVLRAYHQFALSGNTPVCDLEIVDTGDGRTVAIARQGSELTALSVGDRAIVLR